MPIRTLHDGRELLDSGSVWEPVMGYSRAVRAGDTIHVAGCVGLEADGSYSADLRRQTERCMERISEALAAFGADAEAIVRVRIYTTRVAEWREIAAVLGPLFAVNRPANALIGVAELIDERAAIEIEADAWIAGPRGGDGTRVAGVAR